MTMKVNIYFYCFSLRPLNILLNLFSKTLFPGKYLFPNSPPLSYGKRQMTHSFGQWSHLDLNCHIRDQSLFMGGGGGRGLGGERKCSFQIFKIESPLRIQTFDSNPPFIFSRSHFRSFA